ncbi:MAG: hypothetical protein HC840_00890 [Leptolyngbyaceae cyanobacterium RM2_2_4]|nr:hypothetical protein [Leptolyngbyaceae cyanobacterium RM2_2_4]
MKNDSKKEMIQLMLVLIAIVFILLTNGSCSAPVGPSGSDGDFGYVYEVKDISN